MDYEKQVKDLVKYYQDLLIVQYHDKPKAKAMIKSKIEETLCNLLEVKVRDAFDVDTAVGVQLDIIGKWVGIERIFKGQKYDNQSWFSLPRYNQKTNSFMHGFSTYATFEEEGGFLTYDFILGTKSKLNDSDFRMLIKLKIIRNNVPHSPKPIDDAMYKLFADTLYTVWNEMVYNSNAFTVVGSPTITEDGVASGFLKDTEKGYDSSPNCIRIPSFTLGQLKDKPWSMECSFVLPTITSPTNKSLYSLGQTSRWEAWSNVLSVSPSGESFQIVSRFGNDESNSGNIAVRGWTTSSSIGMIRGNSYTYITDFDGVSLYTYKIKDNKTGNILAQYKYTPTVEDKNLYMVNKFPNETINIGTANSAYTNQYSGWTGSIDLKQFSITVDGKEVFNGGYNQPMEMTFYYNPKRYGIVKLGQEKNCFPIPTGVKANFVEVKR